MLWVIHLTLHMYIYFYSTACVFRSSRTLSGSDLSARSSTIKSEKVRHHLEQRKGILRSLGSAPRADAAVTLMVIRLLSFLSTEQIY
jgi:hypothetical protein